MDASYKLILIIFLSYLIGSFPTAIIVSKRFFGFDIRSKGSGNMGSTNAFRILGMKWGIIVQVVDILKGILAVAVVANLLGTGIEISTGGYFQQITVVKMIAGISAVCGHIWSVFAGFQGGKGINTAAGMMIGIAPIDAGIAIGIFLIAVFSSGYISLGSIVAALAIPSSMFFRYNILRDSIPAYHIIIYFCLGLALLLVFTHRANIKRLASGTENRFAKLHLFKCKTKNVIE